MKPYSVRRGGATHHYVSKGRLDQTVERGRWAIKRTAKIYIQDGVALARDIQLPRPTRNLLALGQGTCIAILRRSLRATVVDGYLWRVERQWRHALAALSSEQSSGEQCLGAGVPCGRPRARRNLPSSSGGAVP